MQEVDWEFIGEVGLYLRTSPVRIIEMAEFAPGIVGIHDDHENGEFDVYFDEARWELADVASWGRQIVYPERLKPFGLDVLQGVYLAPTPTGMDQLFALAKNSLVATKNGIPWRSCAAILPFTPDHAAVSQLQWGT